MQEKTLASIRANLGELLKGGQKLTFRKGQVLFYEGHIPYGVFVIRSGSVNFEQGETPCKDEHLWVSTQGKVVGLRQVLDGTPSCCTSLATEDCETTFISKTLLLPYLCEQPSI